MSVWRNWFDARVTDLIRNDIGAGGRNGSEIFSKCFENLWNKYNLSCPVIEESWITFETRCQGHRVVIPTNVLTWRTLIGGQNVVIASIGIVP